MGKRFLALIISLCFMLQTCLGATVFIIERDIAYSFDKTAGNRVWVEAKEGSDIINWKVKSGGITLGPDNSFVMPENDVEIQALYRVTQYMLTGENFGVVSSSLKQYGTEVVATATETAKYMFSGWSAEGITLTPEQVGSYSITFTMPENDVTLIANYVNEDISGANRPVLGTGMTPVNWSGKEWYETTESEWAYNYNNFTRESTKTIAGNGAGKWANAVTEDGSMWVWIPRYSYKIESGYHESAVSWSSDKYNEETDTEGKIVVKFSDGTQDYLTENIANASEGYMAHPAFTLGTTELTGIWVAKYEMSMETNGVHTNPDSVETGNIYTNSSIKMVSKPNVQNWRYISVGKAFTNSYNYNRTLDSHLMRNSEWGAVAYLTNAIGRIPYINNNSCYITGQAGSSQDAVASGSTNIWNTAEGVKASTTHNVYGIYDLSGGNWERVAAYYTGGDSTYLADDVGVDDYAGALYDAVDKGGTLAKYVEVYDTAYDSTKMGDAMYETSSNSINSVTQLSWDADYSSAPYSGYPVIHRGGEPYNSSGAGIFSFAYYIGGAYIGGSFRAVLAIPAPEVTTYTIRYNANEGTGSPSNQIKSHGVDLTLSTVKPTREGYRFNGWTTSINGRGTTYSAGEVYKENASVTLYAQWTDANAPVLGVGMTPVNWNKDTNSWDETTEDMWKWDYTSVAPTESNGTVRGDGAGKWANAKTQDGSMWVWIPRYSYMIEEGYHESAVSWNSDEYNEETDTEGKIVVKFSKGTQDYITPEADDASEGYIAHPAFTLGTTELTGIWVAKYEASVGTQGENPTVEVAYPTAENSAVKFIPGVNSWRNVTVSDMYDYAYKAYRSADSHLMKNTEWGAVAYLTNAIGRTPYVNNSEAFITGSSGLEQNSTTSFIRYNANSDSNTEFAWNTAEGVKASTTHNVYGIYDMSGGLYEYVSAVVEGAANEYINNLIANQNAKYIDKYTLTDSVAYTPSIYGDAVYETSNGAYNYVSNSGGYTASWDGDGSQLPGVAYPVFIRGGGYNLGAESGIFSFLYNTGNAVINTTFRAVLAIPNPDITTYTIKYNANGGVGSPTNQIKSHGVDLTLSTVKPTREGYRFNGWNTSSNGRGTTYSAGEVYKENASVTLYAQWTDANAPVLGTGMTPVNWNSSTNSWEDTTEAMWKWDYTSVAESASNGTVAGNGVGKWANARTADGSMWVWIPRYSYKIESGYHESAVSWNADNHPGTGKILVKFSNGTQDYVTENIANASEGYMPHPAFTLGTTKLTGIWIAKYEMSMETDGVATEPISVETGNISISGTVKMVSKPNVPSWRWISAGKSFTNSYNYNRALDSHLIRNSEWGAVAYLTNAIGRIPYMNNSDAYITGVSGPEQDSEISTTRYDANSNSNTEFIWNTAQGVKASTTHNVYGIYDMSGGNWEKVAAYYKDGKSTYLVDDVGTDSYAGALYDAVDKGTLAKYVEVYEATYDSAKTGDAIYEISSNSGVQLAWDLDNSLTFETLKPILARGGGYYTGSGASGIFGFGPQLGEVYSGSGFRTVLAINALKTPTLMTTDTWYQGSIAKENITSITFVDSINANELTGVVETWDASDGDAEITCYLLNDSSLIVAGNGSGKIYANQDSSTAFMGFTNATEISGLGLLDTTNVTNMTQMFKNCNKVTTLGVSNWNTANVTNMESVFNLCKNLRTLDISNWSTVSVTNMTSMFDNMNVLEQVTLGTGFSFTGNGSTSCTLPTQNATYIPNADGYWYSSSGQQYAPSAVPGGVADTYYAYPRTYAVIGTANPTAGGSVSGTGSKIYGSTVTIVATPNAGYDFTSWTIVSGGVTLSSTTTATATFTMPANNVEVKANFAVNPAASLPDFTYTGTYQLIDDGKSGNVQNWRIKFLTSGTLTFTKVVDNVDVFLVGGGGGGATGGGGGGYTNTIKAVASATNTNYTITIGAGGAGGGSTVTTAYTGGTSSAFGYTAAGGAGGRGDTVSTNNGGNGGSGGGAGVSVLNSANASAGGSNGSNGSGSSGGAGGTGQGAGNNYGCEFWEATTDAAKMYGGGGGGGTRAEHTYKGGAGGAGGGGRGRGADGDKANGTDNTGGGGGGAYYCNGGSGGSGIVIIRNAR